MRSGKVKVKVKVISNTHSVNLMKLSDEAWITSPQSAICTLLPCSQLETVRQSVVDH